MVFDPFCFFFFFQAEDGIRDDLVTGVQTCALPIFAVRIAYDETLAHKIEAGSDLFLMPSRFEPCGLNQMYSLRYGTPPIVHATGGRSEERRVGKEGRSRWSPYH